MSHPILVVMRRATTIELSVMPDQAASLHLDVPNKSAYCLLPYLLIYGILQHIDN